jgi:hypothetical protein
MAIPAPGGWEDLGEVLSSSPTVCSWGPGRLDVFFRGFDGQLWHKFYDQIWFEPSEPLGAPPGGFSDAPAAVSWGANRIDVVVRGDDGQLWHIWFFGDEIGWRGWENLGAPVFLPSSTGRLGALTRPPTVASWGLNRLDICSLALDTSASGVIDFSQMWHLWFDNGWNAWEPISAPPGLSFAGPPAAISRFDGGLDILAVCGDWTTRQDLYWLDYDRVWGDWKRVSQTPYVIFDPTPPSLSSWAAQRMDVFLRSHQNQLWHKWNISDEGGWQPGESFRPDFGWETLGGDLISAPAAVSWGNQITGGGGPEDGPNARIDLFARGVHDHLIHKWWDGSRWLLSF